MEEIATKFRQLAGTVQRVLVNQVRHVVLDIAVLFGMQIDHELTQGAVQAGNLPLHYHKAGAGQLNRRGKVEAFSHLAQRDVIAYFKIKLTWLTPAAHFHVFAVVFTERHTVVRQVRQGQRDVTDLRQQRLKLGFSGIQLFAQLVHFQT